MPTTPVRKTGKSATPTRSWPPAKPATPTKAATPSKAEATPAKAVTPAKVETPKAATPSKAEATPSKAETPKAATPAKVETPKAATPARAATPAKAATKAETPKAATPAKVETPKAATPARAATPAKAVTSAKAEATPVIAKATTSTSSAVAEQAEVPAKRRVAEKRVRQETSENTTLLSSSDAAVSSKPTLRLALGDLEVCRSKAVSAHGVGISCSVMNGPQTRLVVAKEDGSLALYQVIPCGKKHNLSLLPLRTTGGAASHTIVKIVFAMQDRVLLVGYLSGQVCIVDATTLAPVGVSERIGGALWDLCVVNEDGNPQHSDMSVAGIIHEQSVFCAVADGSWLQMELVERRIARTTAQDREGRIKAQDGGSTPAKNNAYGYSYSLQLLQSVPRVVGANRALAVAPFYHHTKAIVESSDNSTTGASANHTTAIIGADDMGNVIAWGYHGYGVRHACTHLWTCRLPKGAYAKTIACNSATSTVAVGTSLGDVVMIRAGEGPAAGTVTASFSHHKGPVSALISVEGDRIGASAFYATGWHELLRSYRFNAEEGTWQPADAKRRTHYHEATCLLYNDTAQAIISMARDGTVMVVEALKGGIAHRAPRYINTNMQQPYAIGSKIGVPQNDPTAKPSSFVLFTAAEKAIEAYKSNGGMNHWEPLVRLATSTPTHEEANVQGVWCDERAQYVVMSTKFRTSIVALTHSLGAGAPSVKMAKVADFNTINVAGVVFHEAEAAREDEAETEDSTALVQRPQRLECYVLHHGCVTHISLGGVAGALINTIVTPHSGTGVHYDSITIVRKKNHASLVRSVLATTDEPRSKADVGACLVLASSDAEARGVIVAKFIRPDGSVASAKANCSTGLPHGWTTLLSHRADKLENGANGQSNPVGIARMRGYFVDLFSYAALPSTVPAETVFFARFTREATSTITEPTKKERRVEVSSKKGPLATVWVGYCGRGLIMATNGSWWLADEGHRMMSRQREALAAAHNSQTSTNLLQQLVNEGELLSQKAAASATVVGPRTTFVSGFQLNDSGVMVLERDIEAEVESLPLMWKVRRFAN